MEQRKNPHNDPALHDPLTARQHIRGRGAGLNPAGRYEKLEGCGELSELDDAEKSIATTVYIDTARTIVSTNDSPDVGMEATLNVYRGCEHGCIYCFARPTHEWFGLSAGLDFESKIFAKPEAARLLREKLSSPSWRPVVLVMSAVTDCYQPVERRLKLTRRCLEVLAEFRNPGAIITKNHLVTRDIDIFKDMASWNGIGINISITSLDADVARNMEPRASTPAMRLRAVEELSKAGIPVNVMVAPIVPGLTDHETPKILKAVADAGAKSAYYTIVRLPYGVKDLFADWVRRLYPDRADKILNRIRAMRGGKLNDSTFGTRMRGEGLYAQQIARMFRLYKKRYHLEGGGPELSVAHFRRVDDSRQGRLF